MDNNMGKIRYDFFGEDMSQATNDETRPRNAAMKNLNPLNISSMKDSKVVEDSLMEFITEYFNGEVTEEFSTSEYFQPTAERSSISLTNSFGSSSSFDENISLVGSLTSPDTSKASLNHEATTSFDTSVSSRKSISYEIRFINSTEGDGKIKLQIVPNRQLSSSPNLSPSSLKMTTDGRLHQENLWLRQKIHDLERRLECVEGESGRIIGELKRIIERKNEIISHLELQTAGIQFS